jgi:hypothetical protein
MAPDSEVPQQGFRCISIVILSHQVLHMGSGRDRLSEVTIEGEGFGDLCGFEIRGNSEGRCSGRCECG